jgi:hypothetical protein
MIFNLLDFQISTGHNIYYIDILSVEGEDSDMASDLYSLFHLAYVDGEWYFDLLYIRNGLSKLVAKLFG